jgi:hypothetical protein
MSGAKIIQGLKEAVEHAGWRSMETAPRDGSPFLVQSLPYGPASLCMRRVQFSVSKIGAVVQRDLGSWIHIRGIEDDLEYGSPTIPQPSWSIAPDNLNNIGAWRWCQMPQAPSEVLEEILATLAEGPGGSK